MIEKGRHDISSNIEKNRETTAEEMQKKKSE